MSLLARISGFKNYAVDSEAKDVEVPDPPNDSISSLSFSGAGELLAAGSWNNEVRIYEVNPTSGITQGRALYQHQGPVLDVTWNKEGNRVISCGADNAARMYDIASGQSIQVAQHDAPIKSLRWIDTPQANFLATGSWDKTLKYWDLRSQNPIATVVLPERCYSMDVAYPLLVVGTAERHIQIFNLTNPTVPFQTKESPLKWQTRVVRCSPAADGYAIGCVAGRVAVQYIEDDKASACYSYNCHRRAPIINQKDQLNVYAINDIAFHPLHHNVLSTAGSDGGCIFWNTNTRTRFKHLKDAPGPISATTINRTGSIFAYAVSYDWHKGYKGMTAEHPNKIMVHMCKEEEFKK